MTTRATTSVQKALAELQERQQPVLTPGRTAADALRGLPLVSQPRRGDTPSTTLKTPTDPAAKRTHDDTPPWESTPLRNDPQVVKQVLTHDNEEGDSRLALRDRTNGEFVSVEEARRDPTDVVTDYVEKRSADTPAPPARKAVAKKAPAKKVAARKAVSKAAAKKTPAKKAVTKRAGKKK